MGSTRNQKLPATIFKSFVILSLALSLACTLPKSKTNEIILAQIGNKKITRDEFLRRSELSIRPGNFKNKKTVLNNLISEKILALEAKQNSNLAVTPTFQATLKGIKEQSMRDELYKQEAFNKVTLDSDEVRKTYSLSTREYELEFFTISKKDLTQKLEAALKASPERADDMFQEVEAILGEKPIRKVNYKDPEDDVIHESLFSTPLKVGTVIGPLKLSTGEHIIMKVLNWVDHPLISGEDQQIRWKEVQEKLHQIKARKLWQSYQAGVMQGKKMEFDKQSFRILSNWAMKKYLNNNTDSLNFQMSEIASGDPEIALDAPFFNLDGKVWTVGDFKEQLLSHPLVFRTKNLNQRNFDEQLKLAIADMMKDHFLTQDAYKRSLNEEGTIKKTVETWQDAFLAGFQEKNVIDSAIKNGTIDKNDQLGTHKYWVSYLVSLQNKYANSVQINYKELDKISLTNIDLVVMRPGMPYPLAMPNFPVLISSDNLDYAKSLTN